MITGIDETGDFSIDSNNFNYFTAIHIDQNSNRYAIKQSQFNVWESSIPNDYRTKDGEVKGQKIPEKFLEDFYRQVIIPKPECKYSVVKILPKENPERIVNKHKAIEIAELERVINLSKEAGKPKMSQQYDRIRIWMLGMNYLKILKLKCLENILGISFHEAILGAQVRFLLDDYDESNFDIQFKIDKDFIKAHNTQIMWNEMFRQFWRDYTRDNRLNIVQYPKTVTNPIEKHFKIVGNRLVVRETFNSKTNFLDSKDHFEIRMADIIGFIFHRYENYGTCKEIGKELLSKLPSARYSRIILNDV